jgi:hypothetical protein
MSHTIRLNKICLDFDSAKKILKFLGVSFSDSDNMISFHLPGMGYSVHVDKKGIVSYDGMDNDSELRKFVGLTLCEMAGTEPENITAEEKDGQWVFLSEDVSLVLNDKMEADIKVSGVPGEACLEKTAKVVKANPRAVISPTDEMTLPPEDQVGENHVQA